VSGDGRRIAVEADHETGKMALEGMIDGEADPPRAEARLCPARAGRLRAGN
jgi:hypothetical protein